jgi:pimeloyl-ACP methyl ester carboxylesterase
VASAGKIGGPNIVFVHGWSGNAMIWEISGGLHPLLDRYRIHLLNVNGQPNGSSCLAPKVRDLSYGRWLAQVADGLEVDDAYWVGMSFGGFILARLAEWGPERMLGCALLAPAGMVRLSLRPLWNSDGLLRGFLDARFGQDNDAVHRFVHHQLLGPEHGFTPKQVKQLEVLFGITFEHFKPGAWPPYKLPNSSWYAMTCPSMVLVGSEDRLFPGHALIKRARKVLPDLRVAELLPGQGHAVGKAGLVAERIGRFFDELEEFPPPKPEKKPKRKRRYLKRKDEKK